MKIEKTGSIRRRDMENRALAIAVLVLVLLLNMIGYKLSLSYSLYVNMAPSAYYTLSGATDGYFEKINPENEEITVSLCMKEENLRGNATYGRIYDLLSQFAARYDFFRLRILDLFADYDEINRLLAMQTGAGGETGAKVENVSASAVIFSSDVTGVAVVRSLSTFYVYDAEDTSNDDMIFVGEEITAACVSLVLGTDRPCAYFTAGHGETATVSLKNALYMAGYDIVVSDISREEIGENCALLVIASPYYDFEEYADPSLVSEITRVRRYLDGGGAVWLFRSPGAKNLTRLDALCAEYGLGVTGGSYIRDAGDALNTAGTTLLLQNAEGARADEILRLTAPAGAVRAAKGVSAATGRAGAIALSDTAKAKTYPLLKTSASAVLYDSNGEKTGPAGPYTVCAVSETTGGGSLVLVSSGGFAAESLMESDGYLNKDFLFALASRYTGVTPPVGCGVLILNASPLEHLTRGASVTWFAVLGAGIPLAVALCGVVVCLKRKAK